MFKTRIVPISAGTPQELAYAERVVRTIEEKSRVLFLGAPHLPNHLWGLADIQCAYIHDVLSQPDRGNKSPYEFRHGKRPNIDHLHIKVFGCPCQFAPIDGPEHKRASKTERRGHAMTHVWSTKLKTIQLYLSHVKNWSAMKACMPILTQQRLSFPRLQSWN